jgi:hypothetical protein
VDEDGTPTGVPALDVDADEEREMQATARDLAE